MSSGTRSVRLEGQELGTAFGAHASGDSLPWACRGSPPKGTRWPPRANSSVPARAPATHSEAEWAGHLPGPTHCHCPGQGDRLQKMEQVHSWNSRAPRGGAGGSSCPAVHLSQPRTAEAGVPWWYSGIVALSLLWLGFTPWLQNFCVPWGVGLSGPGSCLEHSGPPTPAWACLLGWCGGRAGSPSPSVCREGSPACCGQWSPPGMLAMPGAQH